MTENNQAQQPAESPESQETSSTQPAPEETVKETEVRSSYEDVDFSALSEIVDGTVPEAPAEPKSEESTEESDEQPVEVSSESTQPESGEKGELPEPKAEQAAPEPAKEEASSEPKPEPIKVPTKEELEGIYDQFRKDSLPHLEKMYEMDEETATAFDENPREVLPEIAAGLRFDAMMSTYNAVTAAMPSLVGQVVKAMETANSAEQAFYNSWPDLKSVDPAVVQTAVRSYRQANPTAKLETVIQNAGRLAMINAGLDPNPKPKSDSKPTVQPPRPAAPGGAPPEPPPRPKQKSDNVFADLAEAWDTNQFS